jgi:hypothetical protein
LHRYSTELGGGVKNPALQRVQLLEISQYLEQYLWWGCTS